MLDINNKAKNNMDNDFLLVLFLWLLYLTILVVIYVWSVVSNRRTRIQNPSDRLLIRLRDLQLHQLNDQVDVRPYESPITDHPTASNQDQRELQQLQVDLRSVPIVNSVTSRLDQVDLPPSYEIPPSYEVPPSYGEAMELAWKRLSK